MRRQGMIVPIVLVVVVIMALLGVVLMSVSTSEYSQSALVGYGLRARELAHAALVEANAAVYDHLNAPGTRSPDWHTELFNQAKARAETDRGVLLLQDLKALNLVPRSTALAQAAGGQLVSASVEFLGFKPISYTSNELFRQPAAFYSFNVMDPQPPPPPREYSGFYRVRVRARFGKIERNFSEVHDVKIVQVTPPAREFALFANLPTTDGAGASQVGGSDYIFQDLNRGGRFRVYPKGEGRIFVRGPLVVETEGWPAGDGNGDGEPDPTSAGYSGNDWHGWRAVPATRDGIMPRVMVVAAMGPRRPEKTSRRRPFIDIPLTGSLGAALGDDPGFYILDGQRWYCETQERHGRSFSILGDASDNDREVYRGVVTKMGANSRQVISSSDGLIAGSNYGGPPGSDDDRWVVEPEGGLLGLYNLVDYSYSKWKIPFTPIKFEKYSVRVAGQALARFGMHWEKKQVQSLANAFFSALFEAGSMVLMASGIGGFALPMVSAVIGPALITISPVALGTLAGAIGASLTRPDGFQQLGTLDGNNAAGSFPPGYRLLRRSITRYYPFKKLEMMSAVQADQPLVLDGVLAFEDMSCARPFNYRGAGYVYSDNQVTAPTISGPILPANANDDYLTLFYEGPYQNAHVGQHPLNVAPAPGIPDTGLTASVYSTQGIKTTGRVTINGNLTVGFVNKSKNADDTSVRVQYRPSRLLKAAAEYDSGKWHVSAVSHRTCQVIDR